MKKRTKKYKRPYAKVELHFTHHNVVKRFILDDFTCNENRCIECLGSVACVVGPSRMSIEGYVRKESFVKCRRTKKK